MKIIVTGNLGYVGPSVILRLRATYPNSTIVGIDTGYFKNCLINPELLPEKEIDEQYFFDIRQVPFDLIRNADVIVHLAGISNDPIGNAYEKVTTEVNYAASVRLATQAKKAGVKRFVFASSCSVYGYAEGISRTEQSDLNPLTAYAKSKINTEKSIELLANDQFIITCLRFPTACGSSDRLRLDPVLNDFVAAACVSKEIKILSDGTPWRPLIDVKDMARSVDWAITRDLMKGGNFLAINVGRDEWNYQIRDLAEMVREVIPGVEIKINKNAEPDKRSYRVNFGLYKKLAPNHQPMVSLKQSISELKQGLDQIDFQDLNFRNSQFVRLKVLKELQEKGLINEQLEWIKKEQPAIFKQY